MIRAESEHLGAPKDLERRRDKLCKDRKASAKSVRICIGTGCAAKGSRKLYELFVEAAKEGQADVQAVTCVGCHGFCERGPIVVVQPGDIFYQRVEEPDVAEIFRETVVAGRIVEHLLYEDPATGVKAATADEIPFYKNQERIVLAQNGVIDPESIDDYIATGGYSALSKALTQMSPEEVLEDSISKIGSYVRGLA